MTVRTLYIPDWWHYEYVKRVELNLPLERMEIPALRPFTLDSFSCFSQNCAEIIPLENNIASSRAIRAAFYPQDKSAA